MDAMLAQCHWFGRFSFESAHWPVLQSPRDQWASAVRIPQFVVSRLVGDDRLKTERPTLL